MLEAKTLRLACSAEWNQWMTSAQPPNHGPIKFKKATQTALDNIMLCKI
jgi:hypothetical protein